MGREEKVIQEELAKFVGSVKDTAPMMHLKPRFLYHKEWLDMEFWGQKNYIEMFYASEYHEVGNEYDWANSKQIKVDITFNDMFVTIQVGGIMYDEVVLPILDKFLKENSLQLILPEKPEEASEEDAVKQMMGGGRQYTARDYFIIDGFFIYDVNRIKECILTIDNQMNNYNVEGLI